MWQGITVSADDNPTGAPGLWQRLELRPEGEAAASGALWPALSERLAAAQPRPKLRPDLVVKLNRIVNLNLSESVTCVLNDPTSGRYFHLGERESFILALLDGRHDLPAITREAAARFGPLPDQAVERFIWDLGQAGLLEQRAGLWQRLAAPQRSGPLVVWTLPGAGERLEKLYRFFRSPPSIPIWVLAFVGFMHPARLIIFSRSPIGPDVAFLAGKPAIIPVVLLACYLIMIPVVLSHELAHALACVHSGGRVSRFGLMVRHFLPAAFADVSDLYLLPQQARITVYLAGPAVTMAWAGLATLVWDLTPAGSYVHLIAGAVALVTSLNALTGLVPVAGYDSSEALGEWQGVPNLHRRALTYCWARLRRRPVAAPDGHARLFVWYGLGFVVYNLAMIAILAALIFG